MRNEYLNTETLQHIIQGISNTRIGIIGDFCLDMYWFADMTKSQLSLETPHFPMPVVEENISLGAGGNVLMNLLALGVKAVVPLTVIGNDWRGDILRKIVSDLNISLKNIIQDQSRQTPCYCKPMLKGYDAVLQEGARVDFINTNQLQQKLEQDVCKYLDKLVTEVDVVIVCDQLENGVLTPAIRDRLAHYGRNRKTIIVDSRSRLADYQHVIVKPNKAEALQVAVHSDLQAASEHIQYEELIKKLHSQTQKPVIITLGEEGALYYAGEQVMHVPSKPVSQPLDIVGAGDTFLSAFGASIAAGVPGEVAVAFANLASGVSVRKLNMTGTATPQEIIDWFEE